jgi:hypothetical protein
MIKLTEARAITPYKWVHPDEEPISAALVGLQKDNDP